MLWFAARATGPVWLLDAMTGLVLATPLIAAAALVSWLGSWPVRWLVGPATLGMGWIGIVTGFMLGFAMVVYATWPSDAIGA